VENGLYLNEIKNNEKKMKDILNWSAKVSKKSMYNKKDFEIHRITTGSGCWINFINEGDFYFDRGDHRKAAECYREVIEGYPENIWGCLRMGELLSEESPESGFSFFKKASELVPSYYGSWLRMAQISLFTGNFSRAKSFADKAMKLNPFEPEVINISSKLRQRK
jgi:tetratricopeptide (TPR) repeat protein